MINIQENIILADYTTLHTGGVARYYLELNEINDLMTAMDWVKARGLPVLFLGGGSNLLIGDDGFAGLVIKNNLKGIKANEVVDGVLLSVASGEALDFVVSYAVDRGWWGLENLTSIPGTVGATPVQNVGAYGVEVGDLIMSVMVVDTLTGEKKNLSSDECKFRYRDSIFKTDDGKKYFIVEINFLLSKIPKPKIEYADLKNFFGDNEPTQKDIREAVAKIRSQKFPDWSKVGTAGSFFKNPIITKSHYQELLLQYNDIPGYEVEGDMVKISLGYVLDKVCNLRGYREGKVGLSEAQALVLINYEDAKAVEIKMFVEKIKEKVFEKTKIKINPEVIFIN